MSNIQITIIGAGQAGLLLGICLIKSKYNVTIITDRTADDVYNGSILSNQAMFDTALSVERKYDLNFWESLCPKNTVINMCIASPDTHEKILNWSGMLKRFYQSVDQRLKFSRWLEEFEKLGGNIVINKVTPANIDTLTANADLIIVASGKGGISQLFQRDDQRSEFHTPQRIISCLYVNNMVTEGELPGVRVNVVPGVGEYLIMSGLTKTGPCKMMQFEAIPGSDFDSWPHEFSGEDYLRHAVNLLKEFLPWEAELCEHITLTDDRAVLHGSFTPTIRKPTIKLGNGKLAMGIGDTLTLIDPLGGQGANNAAKAAEIYHQRIIENKHECFDEAWMSETFEIYWKEHAAWATEWTSVLLKPPPPHVIEYLQAASQNQQLANILAEGFNEPQTLLPWITQPQETKQLIDKIVHREIEEAK